LQTALQGTDLTAAQNAYMKARPYYEKIEPVAESFTVGSDNLDNDIDARVDDVPASQWEGFHRIEQGLFQTKSLTGLSTYGAGLLTDVKKLQTLTTGLGYKTCSTRSPAARSPARRSATRTSTCWTSRPTTRAPSRPSPRCSRPWRRSTRR
jgi:hypothetical protein